MNFYNKKQKGQTTIDYSVNWWQVNDKRRQKWIWKKETETLKRRKHNDTSN